jgi:programmed cell death 6-interacting protein
MFHLPLKQTERIDLAKSLHRFVEESYSLEQADEHRDAFAEVQTLREKARAATLSEKGAEDTVRLLARYYRVLTNVRTRFGSAVDDSDGRVMFSWKDAWDLKKQSARYDLQFERACVLFNLAAALSYSATVQKRSDADGLRRACQRFQQAAGALALLQKIGADLGEEATDDLGGDALEVWQTIMLAQAQQCFFEKAAKDKLKPGVVARLAAQARALRCRRRSPPRPPPRPRDPSATLRRRPGRAGVRLLRERGQGPRRVRDAQGASAGGQDVAEPARVERAHL